MSTFESLLYPLLVVWCQANDNLLNFNFLNFKMEITIVPTWQRWCENEMLYYG